ncbi:cob(I)yrinic acid a,c-diamide adenosyltransferase [Pelagibaculum spongiae]|uniref:Corrinoid adenosyltransferase n=1 Tax=Pelagibaculum spongiae TaxID=2080658 RepID=A0A2V1GY35_9GAMM|nr:cob(I)yrinic acid a,c-diamide adenosyltransferase [Pelagibaculum spongiae]PVZ70563.1 cob(I)yrinic acid a,c-diamide adenosyltransferase [Pelagibaculum spongiae]
MSKEIDTEKFDQRMKRTKEVVDQKIAKATEERGVTIVITGNGKGKTSSAYGTAFRALGYGKQVGLVQFCKGRQETGERLMLRKQSGVQFYEMGTGFTWESGDHAGQKAAAEGAWAEAKRILQDPDIYLLVLDEITYMFRNKFLDLDEVVQAIANRPLEQSVIITGRGCPQTLTDLADTVSEIRDVKHAFRAGIKAREGIEF